MSFSTDNRIADLLNILRRSSEIKVKSNVKCDQNLAQLCHLLPNICLLKHGLRLGCLGMSIDNTASRSCVRVKVKVGYEKTQCFPK